MPPVFDKDCKLKVIEYSDHCKSLQFNKGAFFANIRCFFKRLFRRTRKAS
jgi:hypothetical protein